MRVARPCHPRLVVLGAFLGLLLVGWALGRIVVATVGTTDLTVVRDVAADRTAGLTATAHALSLLGSGYVIFPVAIALTVALALRRAARPALLVALGTIGGVVLSNVDKALVGRPRPPLRHLGHVVSLSFPSGHATQSSAFCVAVLLAILAGRPSLSTRVVAILVTVLLVLGVCASRVYLGVHYPSDVIAGAALGTTWSLVLGRAMRGDR